MRDTGWRKHHVTLLASLLFFLLTLVFGVWSLRGPDKWRIISAIPRPIRVAGRVVLREVENLPYLYYYFVRPGLPVYDLRIAVRDLNFLRTNLPDASADTLAAEHKVPVQFTLWFNGSSYGGRIRYRGGGKVHWLWPKKSYYLDFKSGERLGGVDEIDLIVPHDRQFVVEEFNNYRARKLALKVPDTRFVVVRINGGSPQLYWEAERPSKEFLEKQGLSGDGNLYEAEAAPAGSIYDSAEYWKKEAFDIRYSEKDRSDLSALLALLDMASDEDFYKYIFSLLDQDSFYAWSVHTLLARSNHQDWAHNMRLYLDPSRGKFVLLPWDVGVGYNYENADRGRWLEESWNPLANRILKNPAFMKERNRRLGQYLKDEKNLQDDLQKYDDLFDSVQAAFYQDRVKRFPNSSIDKEVERYRQILSDQFYYLRGLFASFLIEPSSRPVNGQTFGVVLETKSLSPLVLERVEARDQDHNAILGVREISQIAIDPVVGALAAAPPAGFAAENDYTFKGYELATSTITFEVMFPTAAEAGKAKELILHIKNTFTGEASLPVVKL